VTDGKSQLSVLEIIKSINAEIKENLWEVTAEEKNRLIAYKMDEISGHGWYTPSDAKKLRDYLDKKSKNSD